MGLVLFTEEAQGSLPTTPAMWRSKKKVTFEEQRVTGARL